MDPAELEAISAALEREAALREKLRDASAELEKKARLMMACLANIHFTPAQDVPALLATVRDVIPTCSDPIAAIASSVPPNQYWRWKDIWARHVQNCVFSVAFCEYLTSQKLISIQEASELLGFQDEWKDRIYLQVEDYLHGVISLVNELSRLAVNSVTMQNFEEPFKISTFVKDVFAGFSMLNLKNDTLRKRFDGLKYDMKKVEEVVYDVSIRKLVPPRVAANDPNATSAS